MILLQSLVSISFRFFFCEFLQKCFQTHSVVMDKSSTFHKFFTTCKTNIVSSVSLSLCYNIDKNYQTYSFAATIYADVPKVIGKTVYKHNSRWNQFDVIDTSSLISVVI